MSKVTPIRAAIAELKDSGAVIAVRLNHIAAIADLVQTLVQNTDSNLLADLRPDTLYNAMAVIIEDAELAAELHGQAELQAAKGAKS